MQSTTDSEATMNRPTIAPRAIRRLARVWSDINYAQRRLFEIQTGLDTTDRHDH
jgi:hypothetical protein